MSKNLQVSLTFTADTKQAQQQIQQLQSSLSTLTSSSTIGSALTKDIQQGINAAAQLKVSLQNATNVNTGKLDLGKFNQQLKQSNMSVKQYAQALASLGPQGVDSFVQLARAMQNAENPLIRLTTGMQKLGITLMNTMRWQISSSLLMGFTSTISEAFSYAQELNTSLNNIRIVTGKNTEEMNKFAISANKAAKALSTSTTAFTDAALIYYQQGLDGKAVEDRAKVTVKLANVTGQSAQEVSEWMTAIWNNFYDGSQSLESYADSIAALGAVTASSAEEIATGLEKFAAVGETVGLSFDYASAALATVTAQTRQSADVVGTAFKTLFARMQDLKLGNTLEDGTTLGQYSEAMLAVGVNIKTASGELKQMDTILDELGQRWKSLDKDQQVALAKSVAGLRQYNQFIALMSNYDTFKQNVTVSEMSTGELNKQADIYAESWVAASKRVKAAAEGVYSSIIDDDFFIQLTNGFADLIETIDKFIDAAGGIPAILGLITSLLMNMFQGKITSGIESLVLSFQSLTVAGRETAESTRRAVLIEAKKMATDSATVAGSAKADIIEREVTLQDKLNNKVQDLTAFQAQVFQARLEGIKQLDSENQKLSDQIELLSKKAAIMKDELASGEHLSPVGYTMLGQAEEAAKGLGTLDEERYLLKHGTMTAAEGQSSLENLMHGTITAATHGFVPQDSEQMGALIMDGSENFDANFEQLIAGADMADQEITDLKTTLQELLSLYEQLGQKKPDEQFGELSEAIDRTTLNARRFAKTGLKKAITETSRATGESEQVIEQFTNVVEKNTRAVVAQERGMNKAKKMQQDFEKELSGAMGTRTMTQNIVGLTTAMTSTMTGITMLINGFKSLSEMSEQNSWSLTGVVGSLTSIGMALPMIISGFSKLNETLSTSTVVSGLYTATKEIENSALIKENGLIAANMLAKMAGITVDEAAIVITEALALGKGKLTVANILEAASNNGLTISKGAATIATIAQTVANWGLLASMPPLLAISLVFLAALAALALVVVSLVAGIKALSDAYNADAIAAEKAAETAKRLSEAYQEVKASYEELKQSLADYKDAQNAIDKLQEGTEEWRQAIQEANAQVLEMLDTYPQLAQYITNTNGRLQISDEGIAQIMHDESQRVAALQNASLQASNTAQQLQAKADRTEAIRGTLDYQPDAAGTGGGALMGATVGMLFGPLGALVGAGIGAAVGGIGDLIANDVAADKTDEALTKIQDLYAEEGNAIFSDFEGTLDRLGIESEALRQKLIDEKDTVQELITTQQGLIKAEKLLQQQKVNNLLYSQEHFVSEGYGEGIQKVMLDQYEQLKSEASNTNVENYANHDWLFGHSGTDAGKRAFNDYAALMGIEIEKITNFSRSNGGQIEYKDKEGNQQSVSYSEIAAVLQEKYAADQAWKLANQANTMTAKVRELQDSENTTDQALGSFFEHGNLNYLDPEIYAELANKNVQISEEQAKLFGYDSVAEAQLAWDEAFATYDEATAVANRLAQEQAAINQTLSAGAEELGVSEQALRVYAETLATTSEALGENKEAAAKMAVEHFRTAAGIKGMREALNKNLSTLKDSEASSLDYAEALADVKENLEKAFGVKVSAEFVKKHLGLIEKVANRDVEALRQLRKELVAEYIVNLAIDDSIKDELRNEIAELQDIAENSEIGTKLTFDNAGALEAINAALKAGSITVSEVESLFANANLALPECHMVKIPNTSSSTSHTVTTEDTWWGQRTFTSDSTTTNTTWTQIPYFGDNPPVFDEQEDGTWAQRAGTGVASKLNVTTTGSPDSDEDLLNYEGDNTSVETSKDRKKKIDDLKKEKDLYRDINEELEDLKRNLESIRKKKDRVFGKDKLKYIQQEKALLDQQIKSQEEYVKQIQQAKEDQYKDVDNYGFSFDAETGRILNYSEVYDNMLAKYEAGINSTDKDSDARKAWDEWWETFLSNTDRYSDTLDLLENETVKLDDLKINREDLDYEDLEYQIEIKTIVNNSALKKLDFQLKLIEDDAYAAAEAIALMGQKAENYSSNFNANEQGIRDLLKMKGATDEAIEKFMNGDASGLFGLKLSQQDLELLQQYQDGMIDSYDNLKESFDGIFEAMDGVFEKINEEFDELDDTLEHSQSVLKSYQNIIELAGTSTLGISDVMQLNIMDSQLDVAQGLIASNKAQYDKNVAMLAEAREGLANAEKTGNTDLINKWKESIKTYEEQVRQSEQDWLSALENGLELSNQRREQAINIAIKEYLKATTGYNSMEELQRIYDQQKQLRDLYVTDYEKVYSLSKLSRQLEKSINDTSNINVKKQLLALEKKINKAKEAGVKMSSYELQNLEREYQIELAKIALEEAQNAKSIVRLHRNAEGGMSYIYTADQNALDQAQQKYEDAIYASQKANKEWLDSAQEGLMQATNTYLEQLAIINNSTTMSVEERNKAISELNEWYLGQQKFYSTQMDITLQNDSDLYERHISTMSGYYDKNEDNFVAMTTALIREDKRFLENFDNLVKVIGDGDNPNTLLGALQKAQDQWEIDTKKNFENAGFDINNFRSSVAGYLGDGTDKQPGVKKILDNVSSAIDTLTDKTDFTEAKNAATTYGKDVADAMEKAAKQIGNVNTVLQDLITKWGEIDDLKDINKTINIKTNKVETEDTGGDNLPPDPDTNPNFIYIPYEEREQDTSKSKNYTKPITIQSFNSHNGDSGVVATDGRFYKSSEVSANGYSVGGKFNIGDTVYVVEGAGQDLRFVKQDGTDDAPGIGSQATFSLSSYNSMTKLKEDEIEYVQPNSKLNVWIPSSEWTRSDKNKMQIRKPYEWFIKSFDTGGYTGTWGPEGRLAMLHQKEIVLNAHDTENILSIVDMVRQMATQLNFNALTMARGLGNLVANTMIATPQTIDQNVTITAEFPNATNREEIKEAFGDLVNLAAQYASRK